MEPLKPYACPARPAACSLWRACRRRIAKRLRRVRALHELYGDEGKRVCSDILQIVNHFLAGIESVVARFACRIFLFGCPAVCVMAARPAIAGRCPEVVQHVPVKSYPFAWRERQMPYPHPIRFGYKSGADARADLSGFQFRAHVNRPFFVC